MFDYALRERFVTLEAAMQYFFGSTLGQLELGWTVGTHDTYYVYESTDGDGITVIKWDEKLDLDFEIKRLMQNVHQMQ